MFGWPDGFVPIIEIEIAPNRDTDREGLLVALSGLARDDDQFAFKVSLPGAIVVAGIDEVPLERNIDRLRHEHRIGVTLGSPQIAYRETITRDVSVDYTHKKQFAGSGEYARVLLAVAPSTGGVETFRSEVPGEIPQTYIAGVRQGLEDGLLAGVIAGFPVLDVAVVLKDCAFHERDSSRQAFQIASLHGLRDALVQAGPVLLEPIMNVVVRTPGDFAVQIVRDLLSRRGVVKSQVDASRDDTSIVANVPAANMSGYAATLRQISRDRASYEVRFDHYAPLPPDPPFSPAVGMRA